MAECEGLNAGAYRSGSQTLFGDYLLFTERPCKWFSRCLFALYSSICLYILHAVLYFDPPDISKRTHKRFTGPSLCCIFSLSLLFKAVTLRIRFLSYFHSYFCCLTINLPLLISQQHFLYKLSCDKSLYCIFYQRAFPTHESSLLFLILYLLNYSSITLYALFFYQFEGKGDVSVEGRKSQGEGRKRVTHMNLPHIYLCYTFI